MKNSRSTTHLTRRDFLKALGASIAGFPLGSLGSGSGLRLAPALAAAVADARPGAALSPVFPNSVDPVVSMISGHEVRIPNSCPAQDGRANLHLTGLKITPLKQTTSVMGYPIESTRDPLLDLELSLSRLRTAARNAGQASMSEELLAAAEDTQDILLGRTQGEVYDGFALLNFNRGAYLPDQVEGQYKMKRLRDNGKWVTSELDGKPHRQWVVTINMLWYGQNFDSDTYLLRIPHNAHEFDEFCIRWRIYSLIQEDLAPTTILNDGFGRIFHGFDSTFTEIPSGTLGEITIHYPALKYFRGIYNWGWGVHPPRVQFLQPVREVNEQGDLDAAGLSFATRTAQDLTLDSIGDTAPEMKAYRVARAVRKGASGVEVLAMLTNPVVDPLGTFREWVRLAADQRQLPPEVWEIMADEDGLAPGDYGPYDAVLAYANHEIYGENPYAQMDTEGKGGVIRDWKQGDVLRVKVINLDNIVHYYRNVDFGAPLVDEMKSAFGNGRLSFEKFSPKPSYGVPKVAEMQWRTGWGYVPHVGIAAQSGLFPRDVDRVHLLPFRDQFDNVHQGYAYTQVSGYWRFDPPAAIREGVGVAAGEPLRDADGESGLLIGLDTEGFGTAKMPSETIATHPDQESFAELKHPDFLRNPGEGGDIIPPTPVWMPFLVLHPETGTLKGPDGRYWVDHTYFHGRPVDANTSIVANIEAPWASGQLFYQFDPLFHDNMIFSYHPRSDAARG